MNDFIKDIINSMNEIFDYQIYIDYDDLEKQYDDLINSLEYSKELYETEISYKEQDILKLKNDMINNIHEIRQIEIIILNLKNKQKFNTLHQYILFQLKNNPESFSFFKTIMTLKK